MTDHIGAGEGADGNVLHPLQDSDGVLQAAHLLLRQVDDRPDRALVGVGAGEPLAVGLRVVAAGGDLGRLAVFEDEEQVPLIFSGEYGREEALALVEAELAGQVIAERGSLAVGKCCDLFLIDSRRMELVGACYDPKSVLATVGVRGPVDYTVVNGKITVREGRLACIDEEKLARDAQAKCTEYLAK